jgi:aryl-alcohol dehydrogenase-like predicted oxidoreductase
MEIRILGRDLEVSEIGFGCMGMSHALLFGRVGSDDVIKERKMKSLIQNQMSLFDF